MTVSALLNNHEIPVPELLFHLTAALQISPTPEGVCMALAEMFRVQAGEVALLRREQNSLHFLYPHHLRDTGAIPVSGSAIAAHTAMSGIAEIFNNFAQVKHARIFEMIMPPGAEVGEQRIPLRIQKLMSVPIVDRMRSMVLGVIQISHKGMEPHLAPDFTREEMHNLEVAADLLVTAPFLKSFV